MGEDPTKKRFGEDWARLMKDLLFDSERSLKFKPELWSDIQKVIIPTLVDKVSLLFFGHICFYIKSTRLQAGYIPIPRVEYTNDSIDLVVENLTLSGCNLFPNVVSIEAHNFIKFSPYSDITDKHHHEFTLTFGQMQADMWDVVFHFRRKTGIRLSDSGLADIVLGGEGLTVSFPHFFSVFLSL
jgi:Family of unknown function (DUF5923)